MCLPVNASKIIQSQEIKEQNHSNDDRAKNSFSFFLFHAENDFRRYELSFPKAYLNWYATKIKLLAEFIFKKARVAFFYCLRQIAEHGKNWRRGRNLNHSFYFN